VGSRAGLDAVVNKKFLALAGIRTPDHPARTPWWCLVSKKVEGNKEYGVGKTKFRCG
jgi:hypothetical protein